MPNRSNIEIIIDEHIKQILGITAGDLPTVNFDMSYNIMRNGDPVYVEFDGAYYHTDKSRDLRKCESTKHHIIRVCEHHEWYIGLKNVTPVKMPPNENWRSEKTIIFCIREIFGAMRALDIAREYAAKITSWNGVVDRATQDKFTVLLNGKPATKYSKNIVKVTSDDPIFDITYTLGFDSLQSSLRYINYIISEVDAAFARVSGIILIRKGPSATPNPQYRRGDKLEASTLLLLVKKNLSKIPAPSDNLLYLLEIKKRGTWHKIVNRFMSLTHYIRRR